MSRGAFDLSGRVAYVAGGFGLIGAATCRALAACGAVVVALEREGARRPDGLPAGLRDDVFDAGDGARARERIDALEAVHGPASCWINAAYPRTSDWGASRQENIDEASWRANVDLQLNAACLVSAAACAAMAQRRAGSLVNVASIYGVVAPDFSVYAGLDMGMPPAYAAIKGGLIAYTRYLAAHHGPHGVRANALCPGGVRSGQPERFIAAYSARTALGRMATPEDIAWPAAFLASDASTYVTGSVLMVDGGWTAS